MDYLLGHHTIKFIFGALLLLFLCSCAETINVRVQSSGVLSLKAEQEFWYKWIAAQKDPNCPLQPFILINTRDEINKIDKIIEKTKKAENAILFVRVNIDNGIANVEYLTTKCEDGGVLDYKFWDVLNKAFLENKMNSKDHDICTLISAVSNYSLYVDVKDYMILDRDSIYMAVMTKGRVSRFAAYNPKFTSDNDKIKLPILYLEKYLNVLEKEDLSKANPINK